MNTGQGKKEDGAGWLSGGGCLDAGVGNEGPCVLPGV